MTLSEKAFSVLVVFTLLLAYIAYTYIKKYNDERDLRLATQAEVTQNNVAYHDQLNQKNDSIQILATQVVGLNGDVSKKDIEKGYWKALYSVTKLQLDSVKKQGSGIASSGTDSSGEYAQVNFVGKQSIASYNGWTRYYLKPPEIKPLYHLDLAFAQFPLYSTLYQDVDKLWRIKSWVDVPGIKFTALYEVDSTLYIMYKSQIAKPVEKEVPFGVRLKANLAILAQEATTNLAPLSTKNIGLDASAEVYYDYWNLTYYPLIKTVSVGVVVDLNAGKVLRKIF